MTGEFTIGVHVLVYLNHHKGQIVSSEALAKNVCTNPARVRKVLSKLKKAELVETKEGVEGGYLFARDPKTVNLQEVAEALGETFVAAGWKSGDIHMPCLIASGMAGVMDEIFATLNKDCLGLLKTITIDSIEKKLF